MAFSQVWRRDWCHYLEGQTPTLFPSSTVHLLRVADNLPGPGEEEDLRAINIINRHLSLLPQAVLSSFSIADAPQETASNSSGRAWLAYAHLAINYVNCSNNGDVLFRVLFDIEPGASVSKFIVQINSNETLLTNSDGNLIELASLRGAVITPEPSSLLTFVAGIAMLVVRSKRKK